MKKPNYNMERKDRERAKQAKAAQLALDWLRNSRYEDPAFDKLATQLAAQGARR